MKMNNKHKKLISIICMILFIFLSQTIVFSALNSTMNITGKAYARVEADIRITDFQIENVSNNAISSYEEYGKNNLSSTVTLPNSDSYILYKVKVTNYGNINMGIKNIDGLHTNLSYELIDYSLKDKLCDENNKCNLGSVATFYIKIKYNNFDSTNTIYSMNLNFVFEQVFNITYEGITNNNYPTTIMLNEELNVTFTEDIPKVIPYSNGNKLTNYSYSNTTKNLVINEITSDVNIVYKEKTYMTLLSEGTYFKSDEYISNVKKIYFVNYIDEEEHLVEWDLSEDGDGSIIGWIDNSTNYNLYIGSDWNIYSKDLSKAFYNMTSVTNIYFDNLNTSDCTSMYYMFHSAKSLIEVDLNNFNTSKVTDMGRMFQDCNALLELELSSFDTHNVIQMYSMFYNCQSMKTLDISMFNTSNVKNISYMFANCVSLTSVDLSNFNTSKVTNMHGLFAYCTALQNINLDNFNTSNVTDMAYMFYSVKETSLDLSSFNTSKVTDMNRMFRACPNLENIYVRDGWNTSAVTNSEKMFTGSTKLPNYDENYDDVTKAFVGDSGYLTYFIQNVTIDEKNYQYEVGMTWEEWVNSKYNIDGFTMTIDKVVKTNLGYLCRSKVVPIIENNFNGESSDGCLYGGGAND